MKALVIENQEMTYMAATQHSRVVIRDIDRSAGMRAVEELQKEVWAIPDIDVVPLSHMVAAKAAGGVLLGAFDGETLVGFVYGFAGYERGRTVHHSHMLGVKPGFRGFNLGQRLKLAQRDYVLAQGIRAMSWTFDPLQSLNAYFNFRKLGVVSDLYFIDFYGDDAASFLHRNGTDRLWVTWLLSSRYVNERLDKTFSVPEFGHVKPLVECGENDVPLSHDLDEGLSREQAVIEIPADINAIERRSAELAFEWREATRRAFTEAIAAGYVVVDFARGPRQGRYLLIRGKTLGDFS